MSTVLGCDRLATCGPMGWQITDATQTDCTVPSGGSCPATFADVSQGAACSPNGLICNYLEGRCDCSEGVGVIRIVDGSAASSWYCQSPQTGCPQRRPSLGSACATPNLACDYGSCYVSGGSSQTCTGGIWVQTLSICPG